MHGAGEALDDRLQAGAVRHPQAFGHALRGRCGPVDRETPVDTLDSAEGGGARRDLVEAVEELLPDLVFGEQLPVVQRGTPLRSWDSAHSPRAGCYGSARERERRFPGSHLRDHGGPIGARRPRAVETGYEVVCRHHRRRTTSGSVRAGALSPDVPPVASG